MTIAQPRCHRLLTGLEKQELGCPCLSCGLLSHSCDPVAQRPLKPRSSLGWGDRAPVPASAFKSALRTLYVCCDFAGCIALILGWVAVIVLPAVSLSVSQSMIRSSSAAHVRIGSVVQQAELSTNTAQVHNFAESIMLTVALQL